MTTWAQDDYCAHFLKGKYYMKKLSIRRTTIVIFVVLLICSTMLTSCGYYWDSLYDSLDEIEGSDTGTIETTNTNETDENSEDASASVESENTIINNDIVIVGDNTDTTAYATAKGLRSAVSIYCTFETTYGGNNPWNPTPSTYSYYTTGSGVIYRLENDGSAFIVTNHHVVYDSSSNTDNHISDKIYVYLYGLESESYAIPATYVGGSANYDIVVLRIEGSDVLKNAIVSGAASAVTVGEQNEIVPGMTTIAIGNPSASEAELGGLSVTNGIVSVDSEYITMTASDNSGEVEFRVIRTDTPVNSGNSGGGLFNDEGELIGIVNAKISSSELENIGYAIPIGVVRAVADNIIDYCYNTECEQVMRGLLGITVTTNSLSTAYDSESGRFVRCEGIMVYEVSSGGLGEAILKADDIIKSITIGEKTVSVTRQYHLIDAMLDVRVGDTVSLVIMRDGVEMTVSTVITEDCLVAY